MSRTRGCTAASRRRPRRGGAWRRPARSGLAEGGPGGRGESRKARRIAHGDVGQDLPIQIDARLPEARHEPAVGEIVHPGGGVDPDGPQGAELALAGAPVTVGVSERLLDRLLGDAIELALADVEALRELQCLLAALAPFGSALDSGHWSLLGAAVGKHRPDTACVRRADERLHVEVTLPLG